MGKRRGCIPALVAATLPLLIAAGCGSSSKKTETAATVPAATTTAQPSTAGEGRTVRVDMGEFFFKPNRLTVSAGKVTITAPNTGKVVHELVLVKTNTNPSKLKRDAEGGANEDAYQSPGEIADVAPGATKTLTVDLKPGKYAIICNVTGHYAAGMYGEVIVH